MYAIIEAAQAQWGCERTEVGCDKRTVSTPGKTTTPSSSVSVIVWDNLIFLTLELPIVVKILVHIPPTSRP